MQGFTSILLAALLLAAAPANAQRTAPQARAGTIDLSDWDFARDGIVDLAGEWNISWGRFDEPGTPRSQGSSRIAVPAPWNDAAIPGKPAGGMGSATYRLNVECRGRGRLALVLPIQHSATRVYVNGRLAAVQGSPGGSPELARPAFVQQITPLEEASCPLQIVAHVSNFDMRNGGLMRGIELGGERRVQERRERGLARDLFALGGIVVLSLLPVLIFFGRREDRAPLWLGIYGLSSAVIIGLGGERLFQPLLAPLGWQIAWKISILSVLAGQTAFPAFLRALYPEAFPRLLFRILLAANGALALLVLATPTSIFTLATPLIYAVAVIVALAAVAVPVRAALQGRRGAWLLLAGSAVLIVTVTHDIVQLPYLIGNKLTPYGLLLFALAPVLLLAQRFTRALKAEELRSLEQGQKVDLLVNATKAGLLDIDMTENRLSYSERLREMLGYDRSTDTSRWPPLLEFTHPEDRERIAASFLAQVRDLSVKNGIRRWTDSPDFRVRKVDGSYIWVKGEGLSLTGADGRTLRQISSFVDISERKQQEIELSGREKFVRDLLDSVPIALAMRDTAGTYLLVNRRWEEYFGARREEVVGRSVRERASERMAEAVLALDREVLGRGAGAMLQENDFDYRGRKYSQTRSVMVDPKGKVLGVLVASLDTTERAAMDERLREQIALTEAIVTQAPNSIFAKDVEGRFTLANRGWSEMSGMPVEKALGRTVYDLYPESAARRFAEEDEKLLAQGAGAPQMESMHRGPKPDQYRLVRKSVLSRGDTVLGLVCSSTDVSEIKMMERKLESEQRRLDLVVHAQQVGIVDWDGLTHATFYSPRFRQILGHAPDADTSAWPDYFKVLVHPDHRESVAKRWRAFILGKSSEGHGNYYAPEEYQLLRADGSYVWVEVAGVAVRDEKGFVTRWIAAVTDVTEQREQREALARQRERLALLVRATKAGFMDWNAVADTRIYSERFKEMLGYPTDADTASWPSLFDMMHPDDREGMRTAFRDMLRGAAAGERIHGPLEYRLRKADGSYLWVRGEGIAQVGADGRTERFVTSYIDITPLREMNLALEESVRLREEVDRIGRHDLKTPLNSIIGIPRLLRDSGRLSSEDAEMLAFVEQAGYRLLNMVNLSLDMFQMERGNYPFTPKAVDLRELLGKVARDVAHHARSKRVEMLIEGPRLFAHAEELLCYSMFANLVKNAVEASPEGGTVTLTVSGDGQSVAAAVHNAGAVPESVRARFFEKYSTAGKAGGSGLGTYSARLMARTQQGEIAMATSASGGTTLTVRLMLAVEPLQESDITKVEEPVQAPATPLSVLVVDDDEYTRIFVQRFLPASLRMSTAINGKEACEAVQRDPPDVIVMDLDMPVMGGLEAAALIRKWETDSGQPRRAIIAMSSHDDPKIAERSLQAGFDRYLTKPVSPDAIRRAVAELGRALGAGAAGPGAPVQVQDDLRNVLPGFLASRRALLDELEGAVARGEGEAARALAHKLAGSFALYGFQWAAAQGKIIEKRAGANALAGLADEVAALRRHIDTVRVECGGQTLTGEPQ